MSVTSLAQDALLKSPFACYYGESKVGDSICTELKSYSLLDENKEANEILLRVLSVVGLRPNFILQPCNGIKNCVATIGPDGFRYIIYDKEFINDLTSKTHTNWAYLSIFAHEVLHHLNYHTYQVNTKLEKRRMYELEADEWSGRICASLGATLEEAQSAMQLIDHPVDDTYSDHPSKDKRLDAIEKGYSEAIIKKEKPIINLTLSDLSMEHNGIAIVHSTDSLKQFGKNRQTIQKIVFVNNDWYVFFTKDSVAVYRDFAIDKELPFYNIMKMKEQNRVVKSIDYADKKWLVIFEDSSNKKHQALQQFNELTPVILDSLFSLGLMLDDLAYGQGKWTAALDSSNSRKCIKQVISFDTEFPYNKTSLLTMKEGYKITMCKYLQNNWVTVLQKYDGTIPRTVHGKGMKSTFPLNEMIEKDISGYKISQADYDGSNWVFIMNK